MPNWCSNSIRISGDINNRKELASKIEAIIGTEQKLFETLLPEYLNPDGKYDQDYYVQTFGTKRDIPCNREVSFTEFNKDQYYLCCDTAWAPPLGFCKLLAKKYSLEIYIQYGEENDDYYGNAAYDITGNELFNNEYPYQEGIYKIDPDAFWDNCKYYIEDCYDNEMSLEEVMEHFSFITNTEDKKKIEEIYDEVVENN